jgi:hypothetical protein
LYAFAVGYGIGCLNIQLTEHGLGPDGQITRCVPVYDVIVEALLGNFEPPRERSLDFAVAQAGCEIEVGNSHIEAATVETDVQNAFSAQDFDHGRPPSCSMP